MPEYQYLAKNLFTGAVVGELELYGVYCTRVLSQPGNFQGTFRLNSDTATRNAHLLDATTPGKYGLEMIRNGTAIWGGIIWSRSYAAPGQTMQVYANTWESYFDRMVFWKEHFIQQKVFQEQIFSTIVTQLQGQSAACNIGLTISSLPADSVKRTVLIPNYEYHAGSTAMNQIVGVDLGLEYTIGPDKTIYVGHEGDLGDHTSPTVMSYDFPGSVSSYWMPESGASGCVKIATLGAGTGNKVVRAVTEDLDAIAAGYPEWWKVTQYPLIADLSTLQAKNVADFLTYKMPYLTPTFDIQPEENFNMFNSLGSDFKVTVQDVRYPEGRSFTSRMVGWELSPKSVEGPETLKVSVDGSRMVA